MATQIKGAEELMAFHREVIEVFLDFVKKYNIKTIEQLNSYKGRKLLDESLWKLLENEEKYGGRYISEGVRNLEITLGKQANAKGGSWNKKLLEKHFGETPSGGWKKDSSFCLQLDHVSERAKLINILLQEPDRANEILDQCLIGCVVLKSEHNRLSSVEINPKDPWRRYREASPPIRVWNRESEDWLSLEPIA